MKKWEEKSMCEILENFDFEKVEKIMKFLEWKWGDEIPDKYEIRRTAKGLLKDLILGKSNMISTGGFIAIKSRKHKQMSLYFYIESCETY